MNLSNKNILITGASSGIGRELAIQLSERNCRLFLLARRKELLNQLAFELNNQNVFTFQCDVSDRKNVASVFEKIRKISSIDAAILNAGLDKRGPFENTELADKILGVNIMGLIYCVEELLSDFKKRGEGIIAGVSSLAEVRGFPKSGFYCASKAAASIFLESIRIELKLYKIKVITIKPGFVKTPMTAKNKFFMPFLMDVEKAARIIIKGIEKEKKIIQFPFRLVVLAKLVKILPDSLFDFFSSKVKE
jgi:short-subunit dehydrogenase